MADYYLAQAPVGNDGTGTADDPNLPFATYNAIESAGLGDGDRLFIIGDYEIGSGDNTGFIDITANYKIAGYQGRPVVTGNNAVRVFRNSSSAGPGDKAEYRNMEINGEFSCTRPLEVSGDTTPPDHTLVKNVHARGGTSSHFYVGSQIGRVEFQDIEISGLTLLGVSTASTTAGTSGDTNINVRGLFANNVTLTNSSSAVVQIQQPAAATFNVDAVVERVFGSAEYTLLSNAVNFILLEVENNAVIRGCDLTLTSSGPGDNRGLLVNGTASFNAEGAVIADNIIRFPTNVGDAITLGDEADTFARTGTISGNNVTGIYDATATPHGIALRHLTTGKILGNVVRDSYAAILVSRTTEAEVVGNLTYNCHGPNLYIKGVGYTGSTAHEDNYVANNVCVVPSTCLLRNFGVIAVNQQSGDNTTWCAIEGNTVIVEDPVGNVARGAYLASISDSSQLCEFRRNLYIIPDTIDISTQVLFKIGSGGGSEITLADWNADSRVTEDQIIQLPAAEIAALVASYATAAEPGGAGGGNGGLGIGIA